MVSAWKENSKRQRLKVEVGSEGGLAERIPPLKDKGGAPGVAGWILATIVYVGPEAPTPQSKQEESV